jgi:tRNA-dihydrouridine synthase C
VADIRAAVAVPVVANGEIWSADDAARCRAVTGGDALMLGRGIVSDPRLAVAIARGGPGVTPWSTVTPLLAEYWRIVQASISTRAQTGRLKQWLNYLRRRFSEAERAFAAVRLLDDPAQVDPRWFAAASDDPPAAWWRRIVEPIRVRLD